MIEEQKVNIANSIIEKADGVLLETYKDAVQPLVKPVSSTLGRLLSNLLTPIRGLCWGIEKIESAVCEGLEKRLEKVSVESITTPDPIVSVRTFQALLYSAQVDTLREMYIELLASAMNKDKAKIVHPSFVDTIMQMNPLDAMVFEKIAKSKGIRVIRDMLTSYGAQSKYDKDDKPVIMNIHSWASPDFITDIYDRSDIESCLSRLERFGLIRVLVIFENITLDELPKYGLGDFVKDELQKKDSLEVGKYEFSAEVGMLWLSPFGENFADSCLPN